MTLMVCKQVNFSAFARTARVRNECVEEEGRGAMLRFQIGSLTSGLGFPWSFGIIKECDIVWVNAKASPWNHTKCRSQSGPRSLPIRSVRFSPTKITNLLYEFGSKCTDLLYFRPRCLKSADFSSLGRIWLLACCWRSWDLLNKYLQRLQSIQSGVYFLPHFLALPAGAFLS